MTEPEQTARDDTAPDHGRDGDRPSGREVRDLRPEGDDRMVTGEPLDTGDGLVVPAQQNVGARTMQGQGEWPDPDTPPEPPAPGSVLEPEEADDDG